MKIICIGRNYLDHINELQNEVPEDPVIFLKPDTAILKNNEPFFYPDFSKEIHHEVEFIVKISKEGKYIQEKFADKYYEEIGIGIDFTARDLQNKLKAKGLPWDIAKGFNGSAAISEFCFLENKQIQNFQFSLSVNGEERQNGSTSMMINNVNQIIAYASQFFTLKKGDIIFTGTPKGVSPVQIGDKIQAFLDGKMMLNFEIK